MTKGIDSMRDIEKMILEMSLRDKISQTEIVMEKGKKINRKPGAAFFFGQIITEGDKAGLDELRSYVKEILDNSDIPPLITSDFENGCGSMVEALTPFPYMMGLGATNDPQIAYDYGKATALEGRSIGANWTFSPVSDLNINFRNPLINVRGMTDDAILAEKMLPQIVKGMQDYGLAACAKHFPGDGMDYRDQHVVTTKNTLSMDEWYDTYGRVYKSMISAGVESIMLGHIALPAYYDGEESQMPATLNKKLINDLLKGELGFKGVVITDALRMGGFMSWYPTRRQSEIEAIKAGCDMMLWPTEHYVDDIENAVLTGYIPEERINDAVRRILSLKNRLGLFEEDYEPFKLLTEEDKQFVKSVQTACSNQSITLIRDDLNVFPFDKNKIKNIGIVPIVEYSPVKEIALSMKDYFEERGFNVEIERDDIEEFYERNDVVIYELFSRPFRPQGFLDYTEGRAHMISTSFMGPNAREKNIVVSFGSPYFGNQYYERAKTYINAYSMLSCSVEAFVKAACGEIEFEGKSPVKLDR